MDQIDYVLVYPKKDVCKNFENMRNFKEEARKIYLNNLKINGLEIKEIEDKDLIFVLIKIPFEKFLEVAEKVKFKLPIEKNDTKYNIRKATSFWNKFNFLQPAEIKIENNKEFVLAPYSSNLRYK